MSAVETDELSGHDAAITAYMAACGVALGAILLVLLQRLPGGRVIWALFPVLIGLLGLVMRWTSAPLMLLLILAACLHLQSRRALVSDMILCSAVLAYVTGHFRLQSLLVEVFPADPRSREGRAGAVGCTWAPARTRSPAARPPAGVAAGDCRVPFRAAPLGSRGGGVPDAAVPQLGQSRVAAIRLAARASGVGGRRRRLPGCGLHRLLAAQ